MTPKRVIGNKGSIPWHIPSDLRRFNQTTINHTVVMGRKTFNSIISRYGKPLDNRMNIVLTRKHKEIRYIEGVYVSSVGKVNKLADSEDEVFIIGGAEIYKLFFNKANRLYITIVNANIYGDTSFPEIKLNEWVIINHIPMLQEDDDVYPSFFVLYERTRIRNY